MAHDISSMGTAEVRARYTRHWIDARTPRSVRWYADCAKWSGLDQGRCMDGNLAWSLWQAAERTPGTVAVEDGTQRSTYAELRDRAAVIANALEQRGIAPGDRVAILLGRSAEGVAAYFGTLACGAVAVVLNEALRPRQLLHILADAGVRLLVSTPAIMAQQAPELASVIELLDPTELAGRYTWRIPEAVHDRTVAQIVHTSGSTGAPKGVMVGHGNLRSAATVVTGYLGIRATDRIAGLLPFSAVYGMSQVLCAVTAGATLVVARSTLPRAIVVWLEMARITVLAAVPPLWARLLNGGGFREAVLPDLRVMTNAGGHLPVELVRQLRRARPCARLFLMYGMSEVLRSTYLSPEEVDRRPDSIGRAVPGAEVRVVDEGGRAVLPGEVGELVHRGPTVTLGYWNDPVRTGEVFRSVPGFTGHGEVAVRSGDLVRADEEGYLYYVGRKDRVIKAMGFRVGPDEVGDVLYASGEVEEAAVVGEPDALWGARIVAHLVLRSEGSLTRLKAFCARELPRHMRPARFELHQVLPLLPSGKHDLLALHTTR